MALRYAFLILFALLTTTYLLFVPPSQNGPILADEAVVSKRDQNDLDDLEIAHIKKRVAEAEHVLEEAKRDLDGLEIGHIERRVAEAEHVLEEAKRDLREAKMRIRNRRPEERQRGRGNHSLPEFVRPSVEDERVGVCTAIRRSIAMLTDFFLLD